METECAFCGAFTWKRKTVWCDDCATRHEVCVPCAEALAADAEGAGYALVA